MLSGPLSEPAGGFLIVRKYLVKQDRRADPMKIFDLWICGPALRDDSLAILRGNNVIVIVGRSAVKLGPSRQVP